MLEVSIFLIGIVTGYIGAFIPGVASSLSVGSFILIGIPPQIAKTTFQIGGVGFTLGGLPQLVRENHTRSDYLIILSVIAFIGGFIGGKILVSIPTLVLLKLTGAFMLVFLCINIFSPEIGVLSRSISRTRRYIGYGIYLLLNIIGAVFPAGIGVIYQFFYTFGLGMTILESKIIAKVAYLFYLPGLLIPIIEANIFHLSYIILYGIGSYIGSHSGIKHSSKKGNAFLKNITMIVIGCFGVYFLFSS